MFRRKSSKAAKRSSYGETSSRADSTITTTTTHSNSNTTANNNNNSNNSNNDDAGMEASKWRSADLHARLAGERRRRMTAPGHGHGHGNGNNSEDLFLTLANDAASVTTSNAEGTSSTSQQQQTQRPAQGQRRRSRTTLSSNAPPPPPPSVATAALLTAHPKLSQSLTSSKADSSPIASSAAAEGGVGSAKYRRHSTQTPAHASHFTSSRSQQSEPPPLPSSETSDQHQQQISSTTTYRARAAAANGRRTHSVGDKDLTIKASKQINIPTPPLTAHSFSPSTPSEPVPIAPPPKQVSGLRQMLSQSPGDAESVGSTTAGSTVWDELDELKSRIRHLEQGGGSATKSRNGDSAATAMDANERPYTATTTTTTSTSSNPLRNHQAFQNGTHPMNAAPNLLRSALGKSKILVDNEVYQALESSVSDALNVSAMVNILVNKQDGMSSAAAAVADKRVKRQTDNLCRSLTELCISLCEYRQRMDRLEAVNEVSPPGSRNKSLAFHNLEEHSPSHYLEERRARLDRSDRLSVRTTGSNRQAGLSLVRPDSRRSSILSRDIDDSVSPRTGVTNRPLSQYRDDMSEYAQSDPDATVRFPTRAMTDANHRPSPRPQQHHSSSGYGRNDYNSHRPPHPLQVSLETKSAIEQTLAQNRSNMSLNSSRSTMTYASALHHQESQTPMVNDAVSIRSRYPPSVAASTSSRYLEEKRQQRVASAGQLTGMLGMGLGGRPGSSNSGGGRMMPGTFINDY